MIRCPQCALDAPAGNRFCGRCGNALSTSSEFATEVLTRSATVRLSPIVSKERFAFGTVLSQRYRILEQIGRGGMGEVYRASDMLLGQTVALKFLPEELLRSQPALERLRDEVRLARQISHPNICRVYDMGEADGQLFLSMEFIDGENLGSLLRRIGRLPGDKAIQVARRLCSGLTAAHEKGILHRDLKPANIMIDGRGQARITDFGLAVTADCVNLADLGSGTPAYMSPEQLAGLEVTVRSDIYSLGLVLYEVFTGKPAFPSEGDIRKAHKAPPAPVSSLAPDIDPRVEQAINCCLDPVPRNRPPSAMAVAAFLPGGDQLSVALAAGETPSPELVAAAEPAARMSSRAAAACFAVLVITLTLTAWITGPKLLFSALGPDNDGSAMAQTARDVLAGLGYADKPAWSYWGYAADENRVFRLRAMGGEAARREIAKDNPAYFWYRAAPRPISGQTNPYMEAVTDIDPPLSMTGMVLVRLTQDRRLVFFAAVPPAVEETRATAPMDGAGLFAIARLDLAQFRRASPVWTPPTAFDARAAWIEIGRSDPLRVEVAAWKGRPVFFKIGPDRAADPAAQLGFGSGALLSFALRLGILLVLGWHNLRRGSIDRKAAARLGVFLGGAVMLLHLLQISYSIDLRGYYLLVGILGNSLWTGSVSALGYIAIEPLIRKRWPRALITWARLVNGNVRDASVAQDILAGLTFGATVALVVRACDGFFSGIVNCWSYVVSSSPSHIAAGLLGMLPSTVVESAGFYCAILLATALLRREWLGAGSVALLMAAAAADPAHWAVAFVISSALFAAGAVFALRFGYLALAAAFLPVKVVGAFPLTLDLSAFYAASSIASLGILIGLGLYAYRRAAAGRPRAMQTS